MQIRPDQLSELVEIPRDDLRPQAARHEPIEQPFLDRDMLIVGRNLAVIALEIGQLPKRSTQLGQQLASRLLDELATGKIEGDPAVAQELVA